MKWLRGASLLCASILATEARGVILLGTADPAANTTAPTGVLAGSGWQYEGIFGGFLGTPIAPNFFITAKHIGASSSVLQFNGVSYPVVRQYNDAFSDFSIWQVTGTFPSFAPLYSSGAETSQRLVVIGRGTQRGLDIIFGGTLRGWNWGGSDGVQRWGENYVTSIVQDGPANAYVYATFDQTGSPNEAHLSVGDSGGAVFIQEAGVWKLAGINYAVDGPFFPDASGNGGFNAAFFDARGFFYQDGDNPPHYTQITGTTPQPSGFYATQVSSKLGWIYSVIVPNGDFNGNGIPNRLEYARALNAAAPSGPGAAPVTTEGGFLALIYRKLTTPNDLQYVVEKSNDLLAWTNAMAAETVLNAVDDVQTVKARVPISGTRMFLRLRITQPVPPDYIRPRFL
ncbi:MAG: hypothetical protein M3Z22_05535 [Verrucomicrobiota bacterium]|nr:hypothetical protein [Verrucomicrobiota bacterium]